MCEDGKACLFFRFTICSILYRGQIEILGIQGLAFLTATFPDVFLHKDLQKRFGEPFTASKIILSPFENKQTNSPFPSHAIALFPAFTSSSWDLPLRFLLPLYPFTVYTILVSGTRSAARVSIYRRTSRATMYKKWH